MTNEDEKKGYSNKELLIKYSSLGAQLLAALIVAVFAGKWLDKKIALSFPLCIWVFPLLVVLGMILNAVRDTSKKKNE